LDIKTQVEVMLRSGFTRLLFSPLDEIRGGKKNQAKLGGRMTSIYR